MNEPTDNLPAAVLERWPFVRLLGQGTFATVYLGLQPGLGREVAVKVLTRVDDDSRVRFEREARLLVQVEHPNVMRVIDHGSLPGVDYFVTLYEQGESLRAILADAEPVEWTRAAHIMIGIARGLATVHARGIVHRDLSQGNVLLTARGPLLLDFGLAFASGATRITETGEVVGTPRYMSPEVIRGQDATGAADVFACGVLLYELLTGSPPFPSATLAQLIKRQLNEDVTGLPAWAPPVPPRLTELTLQMLLKEPKARPTAQEVADRIEAIVEPVPVEADDAEELVTRRFGVNAAPLSMAPGVEPGAGPLSGSGASRAAGSSPSPGAGSLLHSGAFGLPRNHPAAGWAALSVTMLLALAAALVARNVHHTPQVIVVSEAPGPVAPPPEMPIDPGTALESAARIVAPGGHLLTVEPAIEAIERLPPRDRAPAFDERARTHPLVRALDAVVMHLALDPLPGSTSVRLTLLHALSEVSKLSLYARTRRFAEPPVLQRLAKVSRVERWSFPGDLRAPVLPQRQILYGSVVMLPQPSSCSSTVAMPEWGRARRLYLEVQLHRLSDSDAYAALTITGKGGPAPMTQLAVMALEPGAVAHNGYFTLELDPAFGRASSIDVSVSVEKLPLTNTIARLVVASVWLCGK